jgi:hypothetical protein
MASTVDLDEFESVGYLQECNRQYFHLIGLELKIEEKNEKKELVVVDLRQEPIGGIFREKLDEAKGQRVYDEFTKRALARRTLFRGTTAQPLDKLLSPGEIKKLQKQIKDTGYTGRIKPQ